MLLSSFHIPILLVKAGHNPVLGCFNPTFPSWNLYMHISTNFQCICLQNVANCLLQLMPYLNVVRKQTFSNRRIPPWIPVLRGYDNLAHQITWRPATRHAFAPPGSRYRWTQRTASGSSKANFNGYNWKYCAQSLSPCSIPKLLGARRTFQRARINN